MSQDSTQEKTEDPTARRLEKSREDGKIAVSRDVGGVAVLAAALLTLVAHGGAIASSLRRAFIDATRAMAGPELGSPDAVVGVGIDIATRTSAAAMVAMVLLPPLAGLAAGLAQTRGNFTTKPLQFKGERLDVWAGIKRSLASAQAVQQIGLALGKATVLGGALVFVLHGALPDIVGLPQLALPAAMAWSARLLLRLAVVALLASVGLAAADLWLTRWRMEKQLKMSKQEIKDEHKEQEGDPQVKGRRRARMQQIARNSMIAATREASVVVVNPTHYAVALKYSFGQSGAPVLLSKGKDTAAARIRTIARKHQIPIVSDPPVARAIYAQGRVGREIPVELYEVVARVLAYLVRMGHGRVPA